MAGPSFSSLFAPLADRLKASAKGPSAGRLSRLSGLPAAMVSDSVGTSVSLILNHLIAQQRSTGKRLSREAGKVAVFSVGPVRIGLRVTQEGFFQLSRQSGAVQAPADTEIRIEFADLLGSVAAPSSIGRKAQISGDMDFAQAVSATVMDLQWDPENDLARVVGDAQAVWMMSALSRLGISLKDVLARLKANLREYAVYEKELTPSADEFEQFRQGVSALRDDLARLEKRLKKMEGQ